MRFSVCYESSSVSLLLTWMACTLTLPARTSIFGAMIVSASGPMSMGCGDADPFLLREKRRKEKRREEKESKIKT